MLQKCSGMYFDIVKIKRPTQDIYTSTLERPNIVKKKNQYLYNRCN